MPTWKSDADVDNEKKTSSSKRLYTTLLDTYTSSRDVKSRRCLYPLARFSSLHRPFRVASRSSSRVLSRVLMMRAVIRNAVLLHHRSSKTTLFCLNFLPFLCGSRFFVSFPIPRMRLTTVFNTSWGKNLSSKKGLSTTFCGPFWWCRFRPQSSCGR